MAAAAPIIPKTRIRKTIPIKDITNPAIDKPLGLLNTPTEEKTRPNTQITQPKKGTQPKNKAINERTKPAVPIPFDFF
tara:strand:- start:473 stop:706 length:234 start_codon:yes stop_codon:yes gene_type:complete